MIGIVLLVMLGIGILLMCLTQDTECFTARISDKFYREIDTKWILTVEYYDFPDLDNPIYTNCEVSYEDWDRYNIDDVVFIEVNKRKKVKIL